MIVLDCYFVKRRSSSMLRMMMTRQPRSQTSMAVMVLAGGVAALVTEIRWRMMTEVSSWRPRRSRGWARRKLSQERLTSSEEGR